MKHVSLGRWFALLCLSCRLTSTAELTVSASFESVRVFAGGPGILELRLKNSGGDDIAAVLQKRLHQASSSLLVPTGALEVWTEVQVPAGATVVRDLTVEIPELRVPTLFILRIYQAGTEVGRARIEAYPRTMLAELADASQEAEIAVWDPANVLAPVLQDQKVRFKAVESVPDDSRHRLVIVGPFASARSLPDGFITDLGRLSKASEAIILIVPRAVVPANALPMGVFHLNEARIVLLPAEEFLSVESSPNAQDLLARSVKLAFAESGRALPVLKLKAP